MLFTCFLLLATHALATEEWCSDHDEDDHDDEDHADVHPEDFLVELFHTYGTEESCTIAEEGLFSCFFAYFSPKRSRFYYLVIFFQNSPPAIIFSHVHYIVALIWHTLMYPN